MSDRKGRSPKKASTNDDDWERALENQIKKNTSTAKTNKAASTAIALTVTLLPSYLFQAVMDMEWASYLPLYIVFPGIAAFLLTFSYQLFFDAKYDHSAKRTKDENSERETLRYQLAMGYSMFFSNSLFLALALFFQLYLLKAFDKRLNFCVSILSAAGLVYWLAFENEKTVKKRRG
eukprot:TRINITY_DN9909_c0_g1_i2.p1 TRINITY_DN9909_c0_g1~~TRINITY_DN9909_c0_g1_i2.p1  ORF type:complete len:177 (+),score=39.46 TRINITY_DN9909_c0_g1_i2:65-595(+)